MKKRDRQRLIDVEELRNDLGISEPPPSPWLPWGFDKRYKLNAFLIGMALSLLVFALVGEEQTGAFFRSVGLQ